LCGRLSHGSPSFSGFSHSGWRPSRLFPPKL
jgi:hypothetical protein